MEEKRIVTASCSTMRRIAGQSLKGSWLRASLGIFIIFLIYYVIPSLLQAYNNGHPTAALVLSFVFRIVIIGPLLLGYAEMALEICRGGRMRRAGVLGALDVFSGFQRFGQAMSVTVTTFFIVLIWYLLGLVPILGVMFLFGNAPDPVLIPGMLLSYAALILWAFYIMLRYLCIYFIMQDEPGLNSSQIREASATLMTGNGKKAGLLFLSLFCGYFVFVLLIFTITILYDNAFGNVLGIPFLHLIPLLVILAVSFFFWAYAIQTAAVFYEFASGRTEIKV